MNTAQVLQLLGTVIPILVGVLVDGVRTRTRIAVLETRQDDDRQEFHYHRDDSRAHWSTPIPSKRR